MLLGTNLELGMHLALQEAERAYSIGEVPIGAVVLCQEKIIGRGHNLVEKLCDATAHAEMQAITAASNTLNSKYLNDCILFVTIEPCPMCAAALRWAQLGTLVYGAAEPKIGFSKFKPDLLHPRTQIFSGILSTESANLMQDFFKQKRR